MNATTGTSTPLVKQAERGNRAGSDMPCRQSQPDAALWQAVQSTRETSLRKACLNADHREQGNGTTP
ncbi:MAG: hypothetical protein OXI95_06655 [bacterium]|nr:hypothetical protein [Rhodospirillaceae bacterium]MDE0416599.1 hypothetical protein [bacterium]